MATKKLDSVGGKAYQANIVLLHNALTIVINRLEEKDFPAIYTRTSSINYDDLLHDYKRYMEQIEQICALENIKPSAFDKMLCMAMAIEHNPLVGYMTSDSKLPLRVQHLNEKLSLEAILLMMEQTTYKVKGTDLEGQFTLEGYNKDHKRVLEALKKQLLPYLASVNKDYNQALALLYSIYSKGIIYDQGLDIELQSEIANNLSVKLPSVLKTGTVESTNGYSEYKRKRIRG